MLSVKQLKVESLKREGELWPVESGRDYEFIVVVGNFQFHGRDGDPEIAR